MIRRATQLKNWLELHWSAPAYAGGVLLMLTLIFFLAASNTLAGWLYVMGAINLALLAVAAVLPARSLRPLRVQRAPILPVAAGETLSLAIHLSHASGQATGLLEIRDLLPVNLGKPISTIVETLPAGATHVWYYQVATQRRGLYLWQTVQLRTAAPLGLFWCRRQRVVPTQAIVYPQVLPLSHCPLVDQLGQSRDLQHHNQSRRAQQSTQGDTRSLRPYRWGDPVRLVHWRSSARYGELRVRELEVFSGLEQVVIALDTAAIWAGDDFEQAVIAAASLYFYARRQHLQPVLWTQTLGRVQSEQAVLEALARVEASSGTHSTHTAAAPPLPTVPLIWLSTDPSRLKHLAAGSRWLLWQPLPLVQAAGVGKTSVDRTGVGRVIDSTEPLQLQLQARLTP